MRVSPSTSQSIKSVAIQASPQIKYYVNSANVLIGDAYYPFATFTSVTGGKIQSAKYKFDSYDFVNINFDATSYADLEQQLKFVRFVKRTVTDERITLVVNDGSGDVEVVCDVVEGSDVAAKVKRVPCVPFGDAKLGRMPLDAILIPQIGGLDGSYSNIVGYSESFKTYVSEYPVQANNATIERRVIDEPTTYPQHLGCKLVENTATTWHQLYLRAKDVNIGDSVVASLYAKAAGRDIFVLRINGGDAGSTKAAKFYLSSGTAAGLDETESYGIEDVGNGWYRCWVQHQITSQDIPRVARVMVTLFLDDSTNTYQGDGVSGIYIWGAQVAKSDTLSEYKPSEMGAYASMQYKINGTPTNLWYQQLTTGTVDNSVNVDKDLYDVDADFSKFMLRPDFDIIENVFGDARWRAVDYVGSVDSSTLIKGKARIPFETGHGYKVYRNAPLHTQIYETNTGTAELVLTDVYGNTKTLKVILI